MEARNLVIQSNKSKMGSGCGNVGRAVTSITKDPGFESSHRQKIYIDYIYC